MKWKHLVILALAAVLGIVAIPIVIHARSVRMRNECLHRLRQLYAPMECCVPMEKNLSEGAPLEPKDIAPFIKGGQIPKCPCGPEYVVDWKVGGPPPKCPIHGDLLGDTGRHQH